MSKHCCKLAVILLISAIFALAQTGTTPTVQSNRAHLQSGQGRSVDVETRIQSALQQDPLLSHFSVSARVTDTTVELSGTVSTEAAKTAADIIARADAGNRQVSNLITVSGGGSTTPPKR
jgi:osmotically-inducible protein OsmY